MVANLSAHKRGWDDRWEEFSNWAVQGKLLYEDLSELIDLDTQAFNQLMAAYRMPQKSDSEQRTREEAIQMAARHAMEVPLQVMEKAFESMPILESMAAIGNPASVSDAGVGALCARAAVRGAFLNVEINGRDLDNQQVASQLIAKGREIDRKAEEAENKILAIVAERI